MVRKPAFLAASLVLVVTTQCLAADLSRVLADEGGANSKILVERLSGDVSPKGIFRLSVEAGPIVDRAMRIYSEPSHTLLAVVMDDEFRRGAEGRAWEKGQIDAEAQAITTTHPLAGAAMKLGIVGPPATDTHIKVWVYGSWPDGATEERLISDAAVNVHNFSFSSSVNGSAAKSTEHCCTNSSCGQRCVTCTGPTFCCCLVSPNCTIQCAPCEPCA